MSVGSPPSSPQVFPPAGQGSAPAGLKFGFEQAPGQSPLPQLPSGLAGQPSPLGQPAMDAFGPQAGANLNQQPGFPASMGTLPGMQQQASMADVMATQFGELPAQGPAAQTLPLGAATPSVPVPRFGEGQAPGATLPAPAQTAPPLPGAAPAGQPALEPPLTAEEQQAFDQIIAQLMATQPGPQQPAPGANGQSPLAGLQQGTAQEQALQLKQPQPAFGEIAPPADQTSLPAAPGALPKAPAPGGNPFSV